MKTGAVVLDEIEARIPELELLCTLNVLLGARFDLIGAGDRRALFDGRVAPLCKQVEGPGSLISSADKMISDLKGAKSKCTDAQRKTLPELEDRRTDVVDMWNEAKAAAKAWVIDEFGE